WRGVGVRSLLAVSVLTDFRGCLQPINWCFKHFINYFAHIAWKKKLKEHNFEIKHRDKSEDCSSTGVRVSGHIGKVISFVLCDSLFATLLTGNFLMGFAS